LRVLAALVAISVAALPDASPAEPCGPSEGAAAGRLDATLKARDYTLTIVATSGSRAGHQSRGVLRLVRTKPDDRSPETGETARDQSRTNIPFYGWTDADLSSVGAPLCSSAPHPPPSSQDPIYPGVLVELPGFRDALPPEQPPNAPVLTIGTLSNLRNGSTWRDGCGIALFVQSATNTTFLGSWREWGRLSDGSGYFCLSEEENERPEPGIPPHAFPRRR